MAYEREQHFTLAVHFWDGYVFFCVFQESEDIDYILSIIDDLTQELIQEGNGNWPGILSCLIGTDCVEQAMLAQCRERQLEMDLRFYQECSLDATNAMSSDQVVCPLCQK